MNTLFIPFFGKRKKCSYYIISAHNYFTFRVQKNDLTAFKEKYK